jgi:hypothetical protein
MLHPWSWNQEFLSAPLQWATMVRDFVSNFQWCIWLVWWQRASKTLNLYSTRILSAFPLDGYEWFNSTIYHWFWAFCAGTSETSAFDETSPSGKDYLAEVRKSSLPTNITLTQSVRISVSSLMTHSYFEISICPLTTYGTFKQTFRTQRWVRYPILVTFDSFLQGKTDDYFFCRR